MEGTLYMEEKDRERTDGKEMDSEEELELKDAEKEAFEVKVDIEAAKLPEEPSFVVISSQGCSEALFKIAFDQDLVEVGKVQVEQKEKTHDCLKVFALKGLILIQVDGSLQSSFCPAIVEQLWAILKAKKALNCIVGFQTLYKTMYTTGEGGHLQIDQEQPLPIKYITTSFAKEGGTLKKFFGLKLSQVALDNQFNFVGGLMGAFLVQSEMEGVEAAAFKVIVDEHRVTSESLRGYQPLLQHLLGFKSVNLDEVHQFRQFRPVLKEMNAKANSIFN
uniref:Proteasome assembly chaperone 1 n=1 Tax=Strombidium rassoulzadegani TaxID=1082188 RepID=A0A7S3CMX2_9SPIT